MADTNTASIVYENACQEVSAVTELMTLVNDKIRSLAGRNMKDLVINTGTVIIKDDQRDRIKVLEELKRTAYGKTVVLRNDNGLRLFHIAQANEGFANIGVINRHAPVAKTLISAEVGDEVRIPSGEFEVVAVSHLERHFGPDLSGNWNNFRMMVLDHEEFSTSESIQDLQLFVARCKTPGRTPIDASEMSFDLGGIDGLEVGDDVWGEDDLSAALEEHRTVMLSVDAMASLSSGFYTRTTKNQEELMRKGDGGLMIVEGVAGSGKTSVALGRTKMLHDRRYSTDDEDFDDFYELPTAVGYVLSSQLIEYLKMTLAQLELGAMQVQEFNELRNRLRLVRNPEDSGKYSRYVDGDHVHPLVGRMPWLKAADRAIAKRFADRLQATFKEEPPRWKAEFDKDRKEIIARVWQEVSEKFRLECERLRQDPDLFTLEGLASRVQDIRNHTRMILEGNNFWIRNPNNGEWDKFPSLAAGVESLVNSGCHLGARSQGKERRLLDSERQLELIIQQGARLKVQDTVGLSGFDRDDLRRLMREEMIFQEKDGRWVKIPYQQKQMMELLRRNELLVFNDATGSLEPLLVVQNAFTGSEYVELRGMFQNAIRDRVLRALRLTDAYVAVIGDGSFELELIRHLGSDESREMPDAVSQAQARLESNLLSDLDTDVLLALGHLISLGYRGKGDANPITHWNELPFPCKVFIDEVQDFTEMQVFLMSEQADPRRRAVTVVGDFKQQLHPGTVVDIRRCFPRATTDELETNFLHENKRQIPSLGYFTYRFRKDILGSTHTNEGTIENPGKTDGLHFWEIEDGSTADKVKGILLEIPENFSTAVVCPTKQLARELEELLRTDLGSHYRQTQVSEQRDLCRRFFIHFTTPLDVKGLEFDSVIVPFFDRYDLAEPIEANSAYVALTRPRLNLHVIGDSCFGDGLFADLIKREFQGECGQGSK